MNDMAALPHRQEGAQQQPGPALAIVMKGYPRLSETFIAQELLGLQEMGLAFSIWALRHPTDGAVHMMHQLIKAPLAYLPEYLHDAPLRVIRGLGFALRQPSFWHLAKIFLHDLMRDFTPNRIRRFGQACVMARELPVSTRHLHVHYLHTPASVVRYAALLRGLTWSFSAHAKDIWTTPEWERREKITSAIWGVTCTGDGYKELARLSDREGAVSLVYHGLDLARFPAPPASHPARNGSMPDDPVQLITIGRAVEKKGFDDLLNALSLLDPALCWHLTHIGGGEKLAMLKGLARDLKIEARITWLGSQTQARVIEALRAADLFILPSKMAASGDRDGLPNVVMEAASQTLPILATNFAGIPEFVRHGVEGRLVPPGDVPALSTAMADMIADPALRTSMGGAAFMRLQSTFSSQAGLATLHDRLVAALKPALPPQ